MAIQLRRVLVCDVCQAVQDSDNPVETLGVSIDKGGFHSDTAVAALVKVFICLDCASSRTLMDLALSVETPEPKMRAKRKASA